MKFFKYSFVFTVFLLSIIYYLPATPARAELTEAQIQEQEANGGMSLKLPKRRLPNGNQYCHKPKVAQLRFKTMRLFCKPK